MMIIISNIIVIIRSVLINNIHHHQMWWSITLVAFGSWPRLHLRPARCPCLQVVQDKAKRTQQGNLLGHLGEDDGGHLGHIGEDVYSHAQ